MGFIVWLYNKLLVRKLNKDKGFLEALDEVDKSSEKLKKSINNAKERGIIIPDELLKYSGTKKQKK